MKKYCYNCVFGIPPDGKFKITSDSCNVFCDLNGMYLIAKSCCDEWQMECEGYGKEIDEN